MKIVLDTSFLVTAVKWKIDWFRALDEHRLYIIPDVEDELEKISRGRGRDAECARIALVRLEHANVLPQPEAIARRTPAPGKYQRGADEALFLLSKEGFGVATQDAKLRAKIKKAGGRVAYIRQRKLVVVE